MVSAFKKGQGATEYIVVLAIVLMVALVVVGLLGFFPAFSGDTQVSESATYWGQAKPISIVNSLGFTSGVASNVTLVLQNNAPASVTVTLVNITSTPSNLNTWNATSFTLAAGGRTTVQLFNTSGTGIPSCTSGQALTYNVTFTYNQDPLTGITQKGSKPLSVICQ